MFPILYQNTMIGFFCIEFTQNKVKLSDEDINRTRNICTQAGIAIYHAELYSKAQKCIDLNEKFSYHILEKIKEPAQKIIENSMRLYKNDYERDLQLKILNNIIESCNQLLKLTGS